MEVRFDDVEEGCKAVAKKASEGSFVLKDAVLIEYKTSNGTVKKIRTEEEGVVTYSRSVQRGSALTKGQLIATVAECSHAIVIKDMCATCGKDLREKGGRAGQRKEKSAANVSMIHHVPELIVSDSLAKELGSADETNLISNRKLVLLVDLDQTIIHTSNMPIQIDTEKHPDVTKYTLMNSVYTTKLRPHTTEFLNKMSKIFEMHIVTYGQRQYAHRIAQILDPEERLFGHRILSRDELFSAQHKTRNLKALFPCGEKLVVIIDDRADVWMYSEALIQIKPYRFFKEVGDINAPKNSKEQIPIEINDAAHEDNVLEEIERVLTNIHDKYYEMHDAKSPEMPLIDVKEVINFQRRRILDGCVIVLSGIVPATEKIERTDIYRLCVQFGATVADAVTDETTHVVAALWGTKKVHLATSLGKHVVSVNWVYACVEKWMKADEKMYELTRDTTPSTGRILGSNLVGDIASISTIAKSDLAKMNSEVDEALSDEDEDEELSGEDSEAEVALDEETIRRRTESENNRKRKHAPEEEYESDSEDDLEEESGTGAPMSYQKLLSRSKKQGRLAQEDDEDTVYDVDDENGHVPLNADEANNEDGDADDEEVPKEDDDDDDDGDDEDSDENAGVDDDDDDDDMEAMAAMVERQVSGEED